jgi:hypothetical protein
LASSPVMTWLSSDSSDEMRDNKSALVEDDFFLRGLSADLRFGSIGGL